MREDPWSTQPYIPPWSLNKVPAPAGGKGGNVTSAGWQVTLCDPTWHVSSRSDEAGLHYLCEPLHRVYLLYFTYTYTADRALTLQVTKTHLAGTGVTSARRDSLSVLVLDAVKQTALCAFRRNTTHSSTSAHSRHLWGRGNSPPPQKNLQFLHQTAAKLCALNLFFGQDNELFN